MTRLFAAGATLAVLLAAMILPRVGAAATPEAAYFAARDAAIARIKAIRAAHLHGPTAPDDKRVFDEDERALVPLQAQMRALVGPVAIKGVTEDGKLSLDGLIEGDQGFGMLDGLAFGADAGKTSFTVTTKTIFGHWLREHKEWWGKGSTDIPQEMGAALRADAFYTQALSTDSAVILYAELPVNKPAGADLVYATLAVRTQDQAPAAANEIFVALARGGRVYIANTTAFAAVGPIAACDAVRKQEGAPSNEADDEFLRCFKRSAAREKTFAAATRAAQALVARLPAR